MSDVATILVYQGGSNIGVYLETCDLLLLDLFSFHFYIPASFIVRLMVLVTFVIMVANDLVYKPRSVRSCARGVWVFVGISLELRHGVLDESPRNGDGHVK